MKALTHQRVVLVFGQDEFAGVQFCERQRRSEPEVNEVFGVAIHQQIENRTRGREGTCVEVCAEAATRGRSRRLGLLGTRFTMEAPFYPAVCARHGIEVVLPNDSERSWIHERYVGELLKGHFREETQRGFVAVVERLREQERIDGVVLGGTELPLLWQGPTAMRVSVISWATTDADVDRSIATILRIAGGKKS
jgi:aspartate/glutamate racemase